MPAPPRLPCADALHDLPDAPIVVGFSGGLDSSVVLHLLARRGVRVRALHVHHGLHVQADNWAVHCADVCAGLNIPLHTLRVAVDRHSGLGIEAAARAARHAAFAQAMAPGDVLVLAHHQDDQAETFLLRALRGAGVEGLAAMRRWRGFAPGQVWRPLLDVAQAELLAYARAHQLNWVEDPGNDDLTLDRVFVRQQVMPLLRTRWPHAASTLAGNAQHQQQAAQWLEPHDKADLAMLRGLDAQTLSATGLLQLPPARRARVLRYWIRQLGYPPLPRRGIDQIEQALLNARPDAEPRYAYAGIVIRRWRDLLHAHPHRATLPPHWTCPWDGRTALALPDGGQLRLLGMPALAAPVHVHARRGGERITLPGRTHRHTLKHVLQQIGLPPWERTGLPLVSTPAGELMAVADLVYSTSLDAWLRAHGARLQWLPGRSSARAGPGLPT